MRARGIINCLSCEQKAFQTFTSNEKTNLSGKKNRKILFSFLCLKNKFSYFTNHERLLWLMSVLKIMKKKIPRLNVVYLKSEGNWTVPIIFNVGSSIQTQNGSTLSKNPNTRSYIPITNNVKYVLNLMLWDFM